VNCDKCHKDIQESFVLNGKELCEYCYLIENRKYLTECNENLKKQKKILKKQIKKNNKELSEIVQKLHDNYILFL
jgi:hypothetical protein